ncbi:MAG: phage portal protein [Fulvimarina manganoxydans]|uniref:phage portal protein n=1 Tax=Fulvimarina manganoxydans TaxID=937218 RepID=UPI00235384AE|nr:phage portal protein [Fulvimarina manganoxydans]MCK5932918.1 phage portal protein [Fulvimarina manganoxydans]
MAARVSSLLNFAVASLPGTARRAIEGLFSRSATIAAAGHGTRWSRPPMRSAGRTISAASPLAAARARDLVHNSPEAAAMAIAFENGVIGDGPSLRPLVESTSLRTSLVERFGEWWERAGISGVEDLATILRLCARELFVTGEFFVHFLVDPQTEELRLRVVTAEQLSGYPERRTDGGGWIAKNVEYDRWGRRIAYWVRTEADGAPEISTRYVRIPAEDMIHGFQHLAAGQIRGLSMLAPIATTLHEIATLRDALLAQAKTGALFGGILTNHNGTAGMQPGRAEEIGLEPGGLIQAPPGWEYHQVSPARSEGSVDFLRANVRAAAAGAGIPYAFVSGDLSDTSYSSAKVGLNEYRRFCVGIQRTLFASRLLQPMWKRWLLVESLAGRIDADMARTAKADFIFPAPRSIDPARETNADIRAIEAGIRSRFEVISATGRDPETVDAEIGQDRFRQAQEAAK